MKRFQSWLWALVLALPIITVAGTVILYQHGPLIFRLYVLYSLALLMHPLVMLFLVLTVVTLTTVMILRHRHRTELLAFAFLFSAVLHLLTVAFFSLWIVEQPKVEMTDDESRHEVASGPPSFSETMVGEDLRGLLQNIAAQDARELESRTRTEQADDVPVKHDQANVELPERAIPLPAREEISVAPAAKSLTVEALLESLPTPLADRDTTKLVHVENLESEPELQKSEPEPKPTMTITQTEMWSAPAEPHLETLEAPLPEVARAEPERDAIALAKSEVAEFRVEEMLEQHTTEPTVDQLEMPAEQEEARLTETPAFEPAEREMQEAAHRQDRPDPVEDTLDAASPDAEPIQDTPNRAVKMRHELPTFQRRANVLTESASRQPETLSDHDPLELADQRMLLPTEVNERTPTDAEPTPLALTPDRAEGARRDVALLAVMPTMDTPLVEHAPVASEMEVASVEPKASPTVTENLSAKPMGSLPQAPTRATRESVMPLPTADERVANHESLPMSDRELETLRTVRAASSRLQVEETPTLNQRPPEAQVRQATSLANVQQTATAAPSVTLPTVSERLASQAPVPAPAVITVAVGGRLMLVEASARTTTLRPAPLTTRDIATAYRRESPDASADVPLPSSTRVMNPGEVTSRVSQRSIVAADSVRSLQPRGQALTVDTALTDVSSEAPVDAARVGRAIATIAFPTTGTVVHVQSVEDVHHFTQGRVAAASVSDSLSAAQPKSTEPRKVRLPSTHTAPTAFREPSQPEAQTRKREAPRARDDIQTVSASVPTTESVDTGLANQVRFVETESAEARMEANTALPSAIRDIHAPRHQQSFSETKAPKSPTLTAPRETVALPSVKVAAKTWNLQAPAISERVKVVASAPSSSPARLQDQPIESITTRVAEVAPQSHLSEQQEAVSAGRKDGQALDVARAILQREYASLPEYGVPPPRTTFITRAPGAGGMGRLLPVEPSTLARSKAGGVTAGPSEPLAMEDAVAPTCHLPVLDVSARWKPVMEESADATGAPAFDSTVSGAGASHLHSPSTEVHAFELGRRETASPAKSSTQGVARRSGGALSRPELSSRPPERMDLQLGQSHDSRANVDDDVSSGAADSVRSLVAAEIAAARELPTKKAIYQLRSPGKRKQLIEVLGGSEDTESAVEEALDWLAASQSKNGRWDVDGFEGAEQCGGRGNQADADVGITGFTLLAFLGAGYTHVDGKHQKSVKAAIDWIISGMKPNGDLRRGGQMYDQAMATTALCEAISLTGDSRLLPVAKRAVQFILDAQNPGAAWRYNPREDNDTSVTGWQILALKSAELAGIAIPQKHYRWTQMWLDQVRSGEEGGLYLYRAGHAVTPVMTAEGWFCQLFMGEQAKTRGQQESTDYVMQHLPVWSLEVPGAINFYYWYYATLSLHLSGSDSFGLWNDALTTALLKGRVTEGPAAGTWDPVSHVGVRGGRIYSTAVATLCLEVYYRFLPFYKIK